MDRHIFLLFRKKQRNFIKLSSLIYCGTFDYTDTIDPNNGIQQIDNMNMSNNIASNLPTYDIDNAELNSYIIYSSFMNLTQKNSQIFTLLGCAETKIISCNYINNKGLNNPIDTLIYCTNSGKINDCCILNNICKTIFYVNSGNMIYVKNCYYDKSTTSGGVFEFLSPNNKSNTIALTYIDPKNCHSHRKNKNYLVLTCKDNILYLGLFSKAVYILMIYDTANC